MAPEGRVILLTVRICKKNGRSRKQDLFAKVSITLLGANG